MAREIRTVEDAESIRTQIESVVEGWYPPGSAIDWEDFLDRVEGNEYDLGTDLSTPAIKRVKEIAREVRRQR